MTRMPQTGHSLIVAMEILLGEILGTALINISQLLGMGQPDIIILRMERKKEI